MSQKRKLRRRVTAKGVRIGRCPSCSKHVSIVEDKDTREQLLLHEMPFCQYYGDTDAEIFAREVFGPPEGQLS